MLRRLNNSPNPRTFKLSFARPNICVSWRKIRPTHRKVRCTIRILRQSFTSCFANSRWPLPRISARVESGMSCGEARQRAHADRWREPGGSLCSRSTRSWMRLRSGSHAANRAGAHVRAHGVQRHGQDWHQELRRGEGRAGEGRRRVRGLHRERDKPVDQDDAKITQLEKAWKDAIAEARNTSCRTNSQRSSTKPAARA